MAKKSERKKLTDKLDVLCRVIIRLRDDNRCQKCNKYITGSDSQPSHVIAKGNGASKRRFDLLNIKLLCNHHHIPWWHKNPLESGEWFKEKFLARYNYLEIYRGGKPCPISTQEMKDLVEMYKEKVKDLGGLLK